MSGPLVSVVTPCLDPGPRLSRCIESVRNQTYGNVEHVIMDGGSTDGTVKLLRSSSVSRWVSEPDRGQTDALNKGFALCTGELLGWVAADDTLTPTAIEAVVRALAVDCDAGWAYGDVRVDEPGRTWVFRPPPNLSMRDFELNNPLAQPGAFLRREALSSVGPLDESLHFAMDMELWMRLVKRGISGAYVPEILATFEVHRESKGGSGIFDRFLEEAAHLRVSYELKEAAAVTAGRIAALRSPLVTSEQIAATLRGIGCEPSGANLDHARSGSAFQRMVDSSGGTALRRALAFAGARLVQDRYARRLMAGTVRSALLRRVGRPEPQRW